MPLQKTINERRLLQRALHSLTSAFPSEFKAVTCDIIRDRLRVNDQTREQQISQSPIGQIRSLLCRRLAANRAMQSAIRNPDRAAAVGLKIEALQRDIQHVDNRLSLVREQAARRERAALLDDCQVSGAVAMSGMIRLINADEFRETLMDFLTAEIELAMCGTDVESFTSNKLALLDDA